MTELETITKNVYEETNDINIIINKSLLVKALSHVQSIVEKRNIIPILSNVRIIVKDQSIQLTATDLDITVSEIVSADVISSGSVTVPAHTFYDIVKKLPDDSSIEIMIDKEVPGRLKINSASCNFSLPFLHAYEFPIMDQGEMDHKIKIHSNDLMYLIDKTKFAISVEETRYNLNGIYFNISNDVNKSSLFASATDGHRLSKVKIDLSEIFENYPTVIIPRKTIIELRKLLEANKEEINISISLSKINFSFSNIELTSKLIDASFPECDNLIPYDNDKLLEVNVKTFAKAIDRVSIISFDKFRAVKLAVSNNKLLISAAGESFGSASEEIDVIYNAEPLTIGFNAKYLLDIMGVIDGNNVLFKLKDNYSPAMIVDKNNDSGIYVIMPMVV